MRIVLFTTLTATVLVAGCAPFRLEFTKLNTTPEQVAADSEACWHYVLRTPEGQSAANTIAGARAIGTFIGGGVLAAMTIAAVDNMADDPKKNPANEGAHVDCMQAKGYAPRMTAS